MEIKFQSRISGLTFYTTRRTLEITGSNQALVLDQRPQKLMQYTFNGYRDLTLPPSIEELVSLTEKIPQIAVPSSAPTSWLESKYMFTRIDEKSLEFLNRGVTVTGGLTVALAALTVAGSLSLAVGISATATLASISSAFAIERLRLLRK